MLPSAVVNNSTDSIRLYLVRLSFCIFMIPCMLVMLTVQEKFVIRKKKMLRCIVLQGISIFHFRMIHSEAADVESNPRVLI